MCRDRDGDDGVAAACDELKKIDAEEEEHDVRNWENDDVDDHENEEDRGAE